MLELVIALVPLKKNTHTLKKRVAPALKIVAFRKN